MPNPNIDKAGKKTRFKKGQTGNPKGRPKLPDLKEVMAEVLGKETNKVTAAQKIVDKMKALAAKGNIKAAEFLFNRGYGLPKQSVDVKTDQPISMIPPVVNVYTGNAPALAEDETKIDSKDQPKEKNSKDAAAGKK